MGVQQVVELAGGALPVDGQHALGEVIVQGLGDGVAFQGTVDARAHEFGVLLLEFTGAKPKGACHCLAQPFVINALLPGELDRQRMASAAENRSSSPGEHLWLITFPARVRVGIVAPGIGGDGRQIDVDHPVDQVRRVATTAMPLSTTGRLVSMTCSSPLV